MRLSATIILTRTTPDLEVYWVKRGESAPFLSGYRVFPGGHLEPDDYVEKNEDVHSAARRAALRELWEETGLELELKTQELRFLGMWKTPPYLVFPMSAYFFTTQLDRSVTWLPADSPEVEDGEWITPEDALRRWSLGNELIAPPTLAVLQALRDGGLTALPDIFSSAEAQGKEPTYSAVHPDKMMIPTRTPTLPPATHTNCYVLGTSELLVVEPASAPSEALDAVIHYLDERLEKGARIKAVFLTHHHHDHIGGVQAICERYGVPVWAHGETASRVPFKISRVLRHGDLIHLDGEIVWRVIFTPGHAPGHICLFEPQSRGMIVGDMVAGVGSILVEPSEGDMGDYLESLELMLSEDPAFLMPSHGPVIGGARTKINQYVDHRLARERACLEALSKHEYLGDLVAEVYRDVPEALRSGPQGGLAGLSLRAHLNKLVKDGVIRSIEPDRWVRVL